MTPLHFSSSVVCTFFNANWEEIILFALSAAPDVTVFAWRSFGHSTFSRRATLKNVSCHRWRVRTTKSSCCVRSRKSPESLRSRRALAPTARFMFLLWVEIWAFCAACHTLWCVIYWSLNAPLLFTTELFQMKIVIKMPYKAALH